MLVWLKLNRALFGMILLGLAGGGIALFSAMTTELVRAENSSADRADNVARPSGVVALGRIEPASEIINLGSGVASDRLESLLVSRGDLVKKGAILGYLNSYAEQIAQRDYYQAQSMKLKGA